MNTLRGTHFLLLQCFSPQKQGTREVDTTRHPTMVFYELYRDVQFQCEETKGTNGLNEYFIEAEVEGKKFSGKACSKKVCTRTSVCLHL